MMSTPEMLVDSLPSDASSAEALAAIKESSNPSVLVTVCKHEAEEERRRGEQLLVHHKARINVQVVCCKTCYKKSHNSLGT